MRFESFNSQDMQAVLNWLNEKDADLVGVTRANLDWLVIIDNGKHVGQLEPPKSRGGRPKGSKNKPKKDETSEEA